MTWNFDLPIAVNVLKLLTQLPEFSDNTVFADEPLPESFIASPTYPFCKLQTMPITDSETASNRRLNEYQSVQVDLYTTTNRQQLELKRPIEDLFSSQDFGCFFVEQNYEESLKAKRLTWRFSKLINYEVN